MNRYYKLLAGLLLVESIGLWGLVFAQSSLIDKTGDMAQEMRALRIEQEQKREREAPEILRQLREAAEKANEGYRVPSGPYSQPEKE